MPLQNRVDPYGKLHAIEARGAWMGNRGILHDDEKRIVAPWRLKRWITCVLIFKGRKRQVFTPHRYSELFFLDEATSFAAGHRPCAECQRERFTTFRAHWAAANPDQAGSAAPLVETIDATLHHERMSDHRHQRDKIKLTYSTPLDTLPDGVLVFGASAAPYLVRGNQLIPWNFTGYAQPIARTNAIVQVLTPRSVVRAIAHGYAPNVHRSAHGAL